MTRSKEPNPYALQRPAAGRRGCNRRAPWTETLPWPSLRVTSSGNSRHCSTESEFKTANALEGALGAGQVFDEFPKPVPIAV